MSPSRWRRLSARRVQQQSCDVAGLVGLSNDQDPVRRHRRGEGSGTARCPTRCDACRSASGALWSIFFAQALGPACGSASTSTGSALRVSSSSTSATGRHGRPRGVERGRRVGRADRARPAPPWATPTGLPNVALAATRETQRRRARGVGVGARGVVGRGRSLGAEGPERTGTPCAGDSPGSVRLLTAWAKRRRDDLARVVPGLLPRQVDCPCHLRAAPVLQFLHCRPLAARRFPLWRAVPRWPGSCC